MHNSFTSHLLLLTSCSLLCLYSCQTPPAAANAASPTLPEIDSLLAVTSSRPFSGVVLVQSGDEVLHFTGAGLDTDQQPTAFTPATAFLIGAISKQVTATLVLREYQRGNINLDWRIGAYLPRLSPGWKDSVTVRQLLNHTHGIVDEKQPLAFAPGTNFVYSNRGYYLLSEILEATTDQSYAELVDDLFASLGMLHSTATESEAATLVSGISRPSASVSSIDPASVKSPYLPDTYLVSSAGDMVRWNEALHQGGILDSLAYQQMITPSGQQHHSLSSKVGYGIGLWISDEDNLREIGHTGYVEGFASLNLYYPESATSLIVLGNHDWLGDIDDPSVFEIGVREALRRYLGKEL
ncbi:MAG: serine hydrolase domain-containing protein [Lewinella sp.]